MSGRVARIDPSGRPLRRAGFEAVLALGIILGWIVLVAGIFLLTHPAVGIGVSPAPFLIATGAASWVLAEHVAGRHAMVWPSSACGIVGPLSVGFALTLLTPELRAAGFAEKFAIISGASAALMAAFLFRFRLPGLVSPVITFTIVALFLTLYGTDPARLREVEGFSPRGIVAALMTRPEWAAGFGTLGLAALLFARRLDLKGDDFGLAAARPLHLVGAGVLALVLGRALGALPGPWDLAALGLLWLAAWAWVLRINRFAVLVAIHLAILKPILVGLQESLGAPRPDRWDWSVLIALVLLADFLAWPRLHRLSRALGFTLGPGGVVPPDDRPGIGWRYWPYATAETLDRWDAERARRREARRGRRSVLRSFLRRPQPLSGPEHSSGAERP